MDKIKILLVQTVNNNLGDPIIADNNEFLIRKAFAELGKECIILRYAISTRDPKQVEYVDAVIFAGGIIKSQTERFWLHMSTIIEKANRLNIPVMLSAVGTEPYEGTEEALILKNALNRPCVKMISVRDDVGSLLNGWLTNTSVQVKRVVDPAIWSPFTYHIAPRTGAGAERTEAVCEKPGADGPEAACGKPGTANGKPGTDGPEAACGKPGTANGNPETAGKAARTVGLGIIRDKVFEDYGHPEIDRQYQLDFWKGTAQLLEEGGYKWVLFTNGAMPDEAFAREVLSYIGHGEILPVPVDNRMLVENIRGLDSVIACRMHANIIAYSLGIPSIGIIWNQKLRFWGERTGYPRRMAELENMRPSYVVDCLEQAEKEGTHEVWPWQYEAVYEPIKEFASSLCVRPDKKYAQLPVTEKLTAFGLGSIERKNSISNSREAFLFSWRHGFRNFKADIRLTTDQVPVCINKWEKETLKNMGLEIEGKSKKLSLNEFLSRKWYDRFTPMTLENLVDLAVSCSGETDDASLQDIRKAGICRQSGCGKEKKLTLILDVGKPGDKEREVLFTAIDEILQAKNTDRLDIFLKIEQEKDVAMVRKKKMPWEMIYLLPDTSLPELSPKQKDTLYMCRQEHIRYLSVKPKTYNAAVRAAVEANGFRVYLISEEKAGVIAGLLEDPNAAFVGSLRYEPDHLIRLTE